MPLLPKALDKALDFTPEDLAANQRGDLTDRQKARFLGEKVLPLLAISVFLFLLISFIVIVLRRPLDMADVPLLLFLGLGTLLYGVAGWSLITGIRSDLRTRKVFSVTGEASLRETRGYRGSRIFYLKIDTVEFSLGSVSHWIFKAGQRYQVFYTPASKFIVSAVALDDKHAQ